MKNLLYILSIFLLGSCTTIQQAGVELPGEDPEQTVLPDENTSSAVISLIEKARAATQQGDYQRAEVLLERTVHIEPKNASLWHYLAKLRLHQSRYQDAVGLAQKSSYLAGSNNKLKADNWRIIAHSRQQMGDQAGAVQAQDNARRLVGKH
ncbi:hypothetical protein MNBD_GAMMA21-397 [hydrothermal vent metagenome]|uniref:Uncharacterized protein n=1 Tax=hydrothermal vent metagenome TaxID=652676 RepID=A0A3B1A3T8_9ZZZZ